MAPQPEQEEAFLGLVKRKALDLEHCSRRVEQPIRARRHAALRDHADCMTCSCWAVLHPRRWLVVDAGS